MGTKGKGMNFNLADSGKNPIRLSGQLRVYRKDDPSVVLFDDHNVIVNTVKGLFARLMANTLPTNDNVGVPHQLGHDCLYSVWGLSLGTGDMAWSAETQPAPTPVQSALVNQVIRKALYRVSFVDSGFNPVQTFSNRVSFQTEVNATTDGIENIAIREMGLIGGGSVAAQTNMLTAPFWDPASPAVDTVTLINYITTPPLILPPSISIIFNWILSL